MSTNAGSIGSTSGYPSTNYCSITPPYQPDWKGFISYPLIKLLSGRRREVGWLTCVLAAVLIAYFVFVRSRMG